MVVTTDRVKANQQDVETQQLCGGKEREAVKIQRAKEASVNVKKDQE